MIEMIQVLYQDDDFDLAAELAINYSVLNGRHKKPGSVAGWE